MSTKEALRIELSQAQRRFLAQLKPKLADSLKLKSRSTVSIEWSRRDLEKALDKLVTEVYPYSQGPQRKMAGRFIKLLSERIDGFDAATLESANDLVFQVKIELTYTEPAVWRRIQVYDCTLDDLHYYIQDAMGWEDMHLCAFVIDNTSYLNPQAMDGDSDGDTTEVWLSDIVRSGGMPFEFQYVYDFGDEWAHDITIERCFKAHNESPYPRCIAGEMACPPEDCGGIYGYFRLLESGDEEDDEAEGMFDDFEFEPEKFDVAEATQRMQYEPEQEQHEPEQEQYEPEQVL